MEDRLKQCPFCGGEAEVIGHYIKGVANNYQYFVRCKSCKARPRSYCTFKKKEEAIEVWNTRKPMDRIIEQLEVLHDMLAVSQAIGIVKAGGKDE
jgi:Lar family restriction alleviation protein